VGTHPDRPASCASKTDHYLTALFEDVVELHGDRTYGDDEAMFAGLATFRSRRVAVLGHRKGTDTKSNVRRNFGSPHPEGFRKAKRIMGLADKFGLPLVTMLDTSGAFPGLEAEERGQAWAIAESLAKLSSLRVPVVSIGIGEGGSGGALAIGFGDRVIMLENSYYSVISPEACASILYRDSSQASTAASCLKLTAADLLELGIADEIVTEPLGGAHREPEAVFALIGEALERTLGELADVEVDALVASRYARLRSMGAYAP